ncbi:RNA polymerase sigma factor [Miltoncostaea marina]|uniref:RNA polymerase sigma factor n=1 Tax=Miltoncostaea marina TaxID=2843215 RepID=UPI001C3D332C|nr:sigma-70 family RNA polymerase sigma factor [Miltoncostaea marina]
MQPAAAAAAVVDAPDAARPPAPARLDPDSREWLRALRGPGAAREEAIARLHELLHRAARFEVARRRPALPHLRGDELPDIAMEAADDALMSVLRRLDDFRGDSRFTTWAYKFALLEAAVKLRRRAWQGREVPLRPEGWALLAQAGPTPHQDAEQHELIAALQEAVRDALTARQREVLIALTLDGVPIDVLAERLGATRGALYKSLHDARRKLRRALAARGLGPDVLEGR